MILPFRRRPRPPAPEPPIPLTEAEKLVQGWTYSMDRIIAANAQPNPDPALWLVEGQLRTCEDA